MCAQNRCQVSLHSPRGLGVTTMASLFQGFDLASITERVKEKGGSLVQEGLAMADKLSLDRLQEDGTPARRSPQNVEVPRRTGVYSQAAVALARERHVTKSPDEVQHVYGRDEGKGMAPLHEPSRGASPTLGMAMGVKGKSPQRPTSAASGLGRDGTPTLEELGVSPIKPSGGCHPSPQHLTAAQLDRMLNTTTPPIVPPPIKARTPPRYNQAHLSEGKGAPGAYATAAPPLQDRRDPSPMHGLGKRGEGEGSRRRNLAEEDEDDEDDDPIMWALKNRGGPTNLHAGREEERQLLAGSRARAESGGRGRGGGYDEEEGRPPEAQALAGEGVGGPFAGVLSGVMGGAPLDMFRDKANAVWSVTSGGVKGALGKVSGWTGGGSAKPKEYEHRQPQAQQPGGGRGGRKSVPHADDDVVVTRAADVLTDRERQHLASLRNPGIMGIIGKLLPTSCNSINRMYIGVFVLFLSTIIFYWKWQFLWT